MFTNIPSLAYCHEHLVEYFERPIQNMSQVVTGAFGHVDNLHMEWHGNASYRWGAAMSFLYNLHHGQGTFPHIPSDSQVPRLTCFQEQVGWEPEFLSDCNLAIFFPFSWIRNLFSPSFWHCNVLFAKMGSARYELILSMTKHTTVDSEDSDKCVYYQI